MTDRVIARDVLLRLAEGADRYAVHAALDERWGRRGEVGFLWCMGRVADGPAARVRLPADHMDGTHGIAIVAPGEGAILRFRLNANVTRKIGTTGKRASWPLNETTPRLRWLERRAEAAGFIVEEAAVTTGRSFIGKGKGFWIDDSRFTGTLRVSDTDRFATALTGGVGQRPAFGFGLLETF